jgi:hypothetical protein
MSDAMHGYHSISEWGTHECMRVARGRLRGASEPGTISAMARLGCDMGASSLALDHEFAAQRAQFDLAKRV